MIELKMVFVVNTPDPKYELNRSPKEIELADKHLIALCNSEVLADLDGKLSHASPEGRKSLTAFIEDFQDLFPDVPWQTSLITHDVDIRNASPVKQHLY